MQAYEHLERGWALMNELDPERMVACSSGTAALHLAFESLRYVNNWKNTDEILCPSFSMVACPRGIAAANLRPRFVDVDFSTGVTTKWDWLKLSSVKGVLAVHTYGRLATLPNFDTCIVEDLAEAHGVFPSSYSDAACWSFYKNKVVAGEEGGAVYFKDLEAARVARELRCLGMGPVHDFRVLPRGMNYRMSNVHANLILQSMDKMKENLKKRRQVEHWYKKLLPDNRPTRLIPWVYDFLLPRYLSPEFVVNYLNKRGIAARYGFCPNHKQHEFRTSENLQASQTLYESLIYLPIYPNMSLAEVEQIAKTFNQLLV